MSELPDVPQLIPIFKYSQYSNLTLAPIDLVEHNNNLIKSGAWNTNQSPYQQIAEGLRKLMDIDGVYEEDFISEIVKKHVYYPELEDEVDYFIDGYLDALLSVCTEKGSE